MNKKRPTRSKYIKSLYMNGLHGRMLRLPPPADSQREILIVYGQRNSLEQLQNFAKKLNKHSGVTIADLPGFGGMQSFTKIGEKPSIDNFAAYLASFIKLRYKNRKVTIIGLAYGFAVITRALQRYPELSNKIELLISLGGFVHNEDLVISKPTRVAVRISTGVMSLRLPAWLAYNLALRPSAIRLASIVAQGTNPDSANASSEEIQQGVNNTVRKWRGQDFQTYSYTSKEILKLNLCSQQVNIELDHVNSIKHHYNNSVLEQHLNVIYKKVRLHNHSKRSLKSNVAPDVVSGLHLPYQLARKLSKK